MIFETAFLQVSEPLNKYRSFSFIYGRPSKNISGRSFSRFGNLLRNIVSFFLSFLIFFELYDAPLFQVLEPSAKYTVPFFWGGYYNFWRCASVGFGAFQKIWGPFYWNYDFENALFQVLVFSKKYSSFFLEPQSLGCAFACFGAFLFFPLFWNYKSGSCVFSGLRSLQKYGSFFSGTIIIEAVFFARWGRSQKYSSFFPGTLILEAEFF